MCNIIIIIIIAHTWNDRDDENDDDDYESDDFDDFDHADEDIYINIRNVYVIRRTNVGSSWLSENLLELQLPHTVNENEYYYVW